MGTSVSNVCRTTNIRTSAAADELELYYLIWSLWSCVFSEFSGHSKNNICRFRTISQGKSFLEKEFGCHNGDAMQPLYSMLLLIVSLGDADAAIRLIDVDGDGLDDVIIATGPDSKLTPPDNKYDIECTKMDPPRGKVLIMEGVNKIVGMLFKVKKNGKVSEEHMNTVSDLTDEITTLMDDVNHNADSVKTNLTKTDEELKEAQKKIEGLRNENLSLRKKISQARRSLQKVEKRP
ncbi:Hypothetical predicted protein [Mytilus galloprovincialis]|uniref:Uncharacterized protein n=1 Tax=Mytilus galloprovincialis TaxID=29158 RepID=A0A8B6H3T8_MYTGA|nr:Hypothetical predicted protein [Mytilus galloprovincialis]